MNKQAPIVEPVALAVRVTKKQKRFKRVRNPEGRDEGVGEFFLILDITALYKEIYIPLSIASGKKPTGFVYHIEGTGEGTISQTDISCRGAGVTQVTLGTLLYVRIPKGMTATFRVLIEMRGLLGKSYRVVINKMHYKRDPSDARYTKFSTALATDMLKFQ